MAAKTCRPAGYDTDLSEAEWELLKPLIYPADVKRGRGRWRDPDSELYRPVWRGASNRRMILELK